MIPLKFILPPRLNFALFKERFYLLEQALSRGEVLSFNLVRTVPGNLKGAVTYGRLYVNGLFMAYTIEPPDLNNIPQKSSIPTGVYPLVFTFSPKFGKSTPRLQNVPNRTGILIHAGQDATSTIGCIVPTLKPGDYTQSLTIEPYIYTLVRKSNINGHTSITVQNYSYYVRPLLVILLLTTVLLLVLFLFRIFRKK